MLFYLGNQERFRRRGLGCSSRRDGRGSDCSRRRVRIDSSFCNRRVRGGELGKLPVTIATEFLHTRKPSFPT